MIEIDGSFSTVIGMLDQNCDQPFASWWLLNLPWAQFSWNLSTLVSGVLVSALMFMVRMGMDAFAGEYSLLMYFSNLWCLMSFREWLLYCQWLHLLLNTVFLALISVWRHWMFGIKIADILLISAFCTIATLHTLHHLYVCIDIFITIHNIMPP